MELSTIQRFRETLQRQRDNLLEWMKGAPADHKEIRFGPLPEQSVETRLNRLDDVIARTHSQDFGICDVCHEDVGVDTLEMDFTACVCIEHFSDEQRRRLEQDLELSHKVQKALLPKETPSIPGMNVAALIQPAEIVGGDYFDFFRFRDGTYGIAIADVMGKGLPASMLVASLQASLRILVPENDSPAEVMKRLNMLFYHNIHLIKFISIVLARYNPETHVLEYCNAGHNPPLHLHRKNDQLVIDELRPTGAAIGLTESIVYQNARIGVQPDDVVLMYTDGATEARNRTAEEYGTKRLEEWLKVNANLEPKRVNDELRKTLYEFVGSKHLQDDLTLVTGKIFA